MENDSLINNKYKLIETIGSGAFGTIYKGQNIRTTEYVAIKVESIQGNTKLLKNESHIYQYLINITGIPNVKWFGKDEANYYMVINLLGSSLEKIKQSKKRFTLKLTLQIGIKLLSLLEKIHDKGLVHRDIKPDNFLLGYGETTQNIYLIDFGLCKVLPTEQKKTHGLIGSLSYASINSHDKEDLTRRDDLESLGYMLLYFYIGYLPWQTIETNEKVKESKINIINDKQIPEILLRFIKYTRILKFNERPNYYLVIESFKASIKSL